MDFEEWRDLIEYTMDIQSLVSRGWVLTRTYGEERLDINDKLILTKGDRLETIYSKSDLEGFVSSLIYEGNND